MDINSFAKKYAENYDIHPDTIKRIYEKLTTLTFFDNDYSNVIQEIEQKCPILFKDEEFWKHIVERNPNVYPYIPLKVKMSFPEVCEIAILGNSYNINNTPEEVLNMHPHLYKVIFKKDIRMFYKMDYLIETNPKLYLQLCHYAIEIKSSSIKAIPTDFLKKHPELYQKALEADIENFKYIPNEKKLTN